LLGSLSLPTISIPIDPCGQANPNENGVRYHTTMLSDEMRQKLAEKLNKYIDVPLMGEDKEQIMAEKVVTLAMKNVDNCFSDREIDDLKDTLKSKLVEKLNKSINVPFANERMEAKVLGKIADFILKDKFDEAADKDDDDE
jgi:hypothetical protein